MRLRGRSAWVTGRDVLVEKSLESEDLGFETEKKSLAEEKGS